MPLATQVPCTNIMADGFAAPCAMKARPESQLYNPVLCDTSPKLLSSKEPAQNADRRASTEKTKKTKKLTAWTEPANSQHVAYSCGLDVPGDSHGRGGRALWYWCLFAASADSNRTLCW